MLPGHLDPRQTKRPHENRLSQPRPPPSLCVTGALCQMGRAGRVAYKIFRPRQMKPIKYPIHMPGFAAPLIALHGGPSIPSNYLLPLVNGVTDRAIVLYDQFGCGRSPRPAAGSRFSLDDAVQDLHVLLKTLQSNLSMQSYHLYGHSFGGILAYEYLRWQAGREEDATAMPRCLSLVLASSPTSTELIEKESQRLLQELRTNNPGVYLENDDDDNDEQTDDTANARAASYPNASLSSLSIDPAATASQTDARLTLAQAFAQRHECRLDQWPLALIDAHAQAGPISWRGMNALGPYVAQRSAATLPPCMLMRGQHDLCTQICMDAWPKLLSVKRIHVLSDCSHYGMLEDEHAYGAAMVGFMKQYDAE